MPCTAPSLCSSNFVEIFMTLRVFPALLSANSAMDPNPLGKAVHALSALLPFKHFLPESNIFAHNLQQPSWTPAILEPAIANPHSSSPALGPVKQGKVWFSPAPSRPARHTMVPLEYHRLIKGILKLFQLQRERQVLLEKNRFPVPTPRPDNLRIEALGPKTSIQTLFVDKLGVFQRLGLLVITGLGKRTFLSLIFCLHVAANLPILHMTGPEVVTFFVSGTAWIGPASLRLHNGLDPRRDVDCHPGFHQVPDPIVQGGRFMVLAASYPGDFNSNREGARLLHPLLRALRRVR
ncbi:hypothetical protein C8J57DRAFT_603383 [Mycena rebaudengoi]|nr:hypothetical protein C8J57DRAFT_603383 [Mycena rebaudengoi]